MGRLYKVHAVGTDTRGPLAQTGLVYEDDGAALACSVFFRQIYTLQT